MMSTHKPYKAALRKQITLIDEAYSNTTKAALLRWARIPGKGLLLAGGIAFFVATPAVGLALFVLGAAEIALSDAADDRACNAFFNEHIAAAKSAAREEDRQHYRAKASESVLQNMATMQLPDSQDKGPADFLAEEGGKTELAYAIAKHAFNAQSADMREAALMRAEEAATLINDIINKATPPQTGRANPAAVC